jgi:septum formation protein
MSEKTTLKASSEQAPSGSSRRLVLASSSRYRRELLARLGLAFDVAAPAVDETPLPDERPAATALRLAEAKARSVGRGYSDALVIGSDQIADCEGTPVGKPRDHTDAALQLARLSGRTIVFHTGLALLDTRSDRCQVDLIDVSSTFRELSRDEIEAYLEREQPYDCAGSVKVEALGIALFTKVASDDPTALIGLPLIRLTDMLRLAGVAVLAASA